MPDEAPPKRRILRPLIAWALFLLLLALTVAAIRIGLVYDLYATLLRLTMDTTGLDLWPARAVALALAASLWLLPWHLAFLPWVRGARRRLVTLAATAVVALGIMEFLTRDVWFSRSDGKPLRYYARTIEGFALSATPGTDPVYGLPYLPITPAIAREILLGRRNGSPDGPNFSPVTGEPLKWFARTPSGRIDLFPAPGAHPTYGTKLEPVTAEVIAEWETQEAQAREKRRAAEAAANAAAAEEKSRQDARRKADEERRLSAPLRPGRYIFASPQPQGTVDGLRFTLSEIDLTPEAMLVHLNVENLLTANEQYAAGGGTVRLGLVLADGTTLAYSAIRATEGLVRDREGGIYFPRAGEKGAFVMHYPPLAPETRSLSIKVNDQPIFSGLQLRSVPYQGF